MHNLTSVFECLHNIAPDLLLTYFLKSSRVYSTSPSGLDILFPKVLTESSKKGRLYTGAQAFNDLPLHLNEVDSVATFKTKLTDIIF